MSPQILSYPSAVILQSNYLCNTLGQIDLPISRLLDLGLSLPPFRALKAELFNITDEVGILGGASLPFIRHI
jgi:hypothetical protein